MSNYSVVIKVGDKGSEKLDNLSLEQVLNINKEMIYDCYKTYIPTGKSEETTLCLYTELCPDVTAKTYIDNYRINHELYGMNAVTDKDEILIKYLNP
jgi:hypothetical protein